MAFIDAAHCEQREFAPLPTAGQQVGLRARNELEELPKSFLLIKNRDGILYAGIVEKYAELRNSHMKAWQYFATDHTSALDAGEARMSILSKYDGNSYRLVAVAPVIGVFGTERGGIRI
jgi:hypothetical protein